MVLALFMFPPLIGEETMTGRRGRVDYVRSNRLAGRCAQRGGGFWVSGEEGLQRQFRKGYIHRGTEDRRGREETQESPVGFQLKRNEYISMICGRRRRGRFCRGIAAQLLEQRQQRAIVGQGDLAIQTIDGWPASWDKIPPRGRGRGGSRGRPPTVGGGRHRAGVPPPRQCHAPE